MGGALKCLKCGSMNVSLDTSTNKLECSKCKYTGTERELVDEGTFKQEQIEKEDPKIKEFNNFNDNLYKIGING